MRDNGKVKQSRPIEHQCDLPGCLTAEPARGSGLLPFWAAVGFLLTVGVGLAIIGMYRRSVAPSLTPSVAPSWSVGQEGRLVLGKATHFYLPVDQAALAEFVLSLEANDLEHSKTLLRAKRVLSLPPGTRAEVVEAAGKSLSVRVSAGEKRGQTGVILADWLAR